MILLYTDSEVEGNVVQEKIQMCKADLHVHSPYSEIEEGVLKTIIQSESYTTPGEIYRMAKKRKMDFVTITDHNSIQGALGIAHLPGVFISEEITVKFPEDECLAHVIALNINETHHREIQRLRDNIYELIQYLRSQNILFFIAHPFSSVNGKLKEEHWEKMLLLFDVFEARNGIQREKDNFLLEEILNSLSPEKIDELANKYDMAPLSKTPWKKSMVGGSDDHGGLYIGRTYTLGEGPNLDSFLKSIAEGRSKPQGRGGTYSTVGRSIYATGYRFHKYKLKKVSGWKFLDRFLDDEKKGKMLERIFLRNGRGATPIFPQNFLISYFIKKFSKKMPFLDTLRAVSRLNKNLPFYAALSPYLFGFVYQNKDRNFTRKVKNTYLNHRDPLRVAVFADAVDTDGHFSLDESLSGEKKEIEILCCNKKKESSGKRVKLFHSVADFPFPLYTRIHLYLPSLLDVLVYCEQREFTVLHVLTPGPMGIIGVLTSKILKLPIIGTYHIDFSGLITPSDNNSDFKNMVWWYLGWFYNQMDRIIVNSKRYLQELGEKNIAREKISIISWQAHQGSPSTASSSPDQILHDIFRVDIFNQIWKVYQEVKPGSNVSAVI